MTEAQYLDERTFPLSSQPGLKLQQQMMLDAANLDDRTEASTPLTPKEQAILRELTVKKSAWSSLNTQSRPAS